MAYQENSDIRITEADGRDEWRVMAKAEQLRSEAIGPILRKAFAPLGRMLGDLGRAIEKARLAHNLSGLDDRTLADIGMKRSDIAGLFAGKRLPGAAEAHSASERHAA